MKRNLLRLLITILLLLFVLSKVDWEEFRRVIGEIRLSLVLIGYALNLLMVLINSYRWDVLVRSLGFRVGTVRLTSYYFVAMFFNSFMPTSIGGDVMRVLDLSRHTGRKSSAMASVIVERLLGLYVLLPIGLVALLILYPGLPERRWFLLAEIGMAALFVVGTILIRRTSMRRIEPLLKPFSSLLERFDARRKASNLYDHLDFFKGKRGAVFVVFLLSLLSRAVWVYSCWVLGRAIGIDLSVAHYFLIMPLVEVGRMLPISLAGMGIREGVLVGLLHLFGVNTATALVLSILIYGIFLLNGLFGGLVYGLRGFFERPGETSESGNGTG